MARKKNTAPKTFCFVLMPFSNEFRDVYEIGIKEACDNAGAYCQRVDEQIFHESILDRIYNQISKADIVIADMTGRNANVFYEVGYAHALDKRTVLLTQSADDIPFDLKHYPHIVYGGSLVTLRDQLRLKIEWYQENAADAHDLGTNGIELYAGSHNLSAGDFVIKSDRNSSSHGDIVITISNTSARTYTVNDWSINVITRDGTDVINTRNDPILMPDGRMFHRFNSVTTLFPGQLGQVYVQFMRKIVEEEVIVFRVYTSSGFREFSVMWPV